MNQTAAQKKSRKEKIWLLILLLFVVFVLPVGCMIALAVPAFQRSVNKSKQSEAESIVRRLTEHARASWTSEACIFPDELPPTGTLAQASGGNKYVASVPTSLASEVSFLDGEPLYFVYSTRLESDGSPSVYVITAQADFDGDGQVFHTVESRVYGEKDASGTCTVTIAPSLTTNEFE